MSVVQMAGISIVGLPEGIEKLTRKFLSEGFFEPMPLDVMLEGKPLKSGVRLYSENPYDMVAPLDKIKLLWEMAGEEPPEEIGERSAKVSIEEASDFAEEISGKIIEWEAKSKRLKDECIGLEALITVSEALNESGYTTRDLNNSQHITYSIGNLLVENWEKLQELSSASPLYSKQLRSSGNRILALVLFPRDYKKEADKLFDAISFYEYSGYFCNFNFENIESMKERLLSLEREVIAQSKSAQRFIEDNRERCEKYYKGIHSMQRIYSFLQLRGEVAGMMAIAGFIPLDKVETVRSMISKEAPDVIFITEESENITKYVQAPTLLRNNYFVRIFHEIVKLYSIPAYGETDPSPMVAFSFCLFFGLMFGDVGHGGMLLYSAHWLEKRGILSKSFGSVIKVAGLISMFFGVLYGSIFGDEGIIRPLWLSPMHDTNNLIITSIVIGVVFLSLGIFLCIKALYSKREWGELLFSSEGLAGLLFYWTALFSLIYGISSFSLPIIKWFFTFSLFTLFFIMVFGNYLTAKIFHNQPEGSEIVHLFSISHAMLSFVSNTASFVRLAAFAMNHAGLSLAVYMLADMVKSVPLGGLSSAIIVFVGNLLIVSLEGLIVFIQTLRLEYYEFFSKFYHGGGREFSPVTWKE
ncbi:MAG: ATPase [Synergistaceae bacterium]|nr:ATPase [Synergistaceae bacterium]